MQAFQLDLIHQKKNFGTLGLLPAFDHLDVRGQLKSAEYSDKAWGIRNFFVVSRVSAGIDGWAVPLEALYRQYLTASGLNMSYSTFKRKLKELQDKGDIYRQKFRVGVDRFRTIIHFCTPLCMAADVRKKLYFVYDDTPTRDHTDLHSSKCAEDKLTKTRERVSTSENNFDKELPARVIDIKEAQKAQKEKQKKDYSAWIHPILFTLLCVFLGFRRAKYEGGKALNRSQRFVFDRAKYELENPNAQSSFVEWSKWNPDGTGEDWQKKHTKMREYIAREQIIPYLEDRTTLKPTRKAPELEPESKPKQPELTPEQLDAMKKRLLEIHDTPHDDYESDLDKRVRERMISGVG